MDIHEQGHHERNEACEQDEQLMKKQQATLNEKENEENGC